MWTERRLISFDETPIFYRHLTPAVPRKACVLLLHGMGEHSGRYVHVAEYLASLGIESFAMDWRGFGQSGGRRVYAAAYDHFLKDLRAVHAVAAKASAGLPLFLIGHSFGGLMASHYAASALAGKTSRLTGLVLSSPLFGIAVPVPAWRHCAAMLLANITPYHSEKTHIQADLLTHDLEIIKKYPQDPLIHHEMTVSLYREMRRALAGTRSIARHISMPVLILQAGDDRVVRAQDTSQFYEWLKSPDKTLKIYPEYRHEVFNELGKGKVLLQLGLWITSRLAS